ncbi:MAG TPA: ribosomal protein S18-alanine N-acetyltransferase [Candidatus Eremiobacteraceae bacterium]|nr:ribosomal protein S18-alanine N-acetyltransferase [Candidatus Eremiobacteraceae bacterium]
MKSPPRELNIEPMNVEDIPTVLNVEALCFPTPWPRNAFQNELTDNRLAHYFVGRTEVGIVAYGGLWVILEDAHITTIAVHPSHQRRGFGERLLVALLEESLERGACWVTLEVRESNQAAQNLYKKYGFTVVNTRRGYYSDNDENALVMWAGNLKGEIFRNRLAVLKAGLD